MPWRSPSRLRSEPGAAARQAPFAGGRLLTGMMLRGYYRPYAAGHQSIRIAVIAAGGYAKRLCPESIRSPTMPAAALPALLSYISRYFVF